VPSLSDTLSEEWVRLEVGANFGEGLAVNIVGQGLFVMEEDREDREAACWVGGSRGKGV
jgi:hypothetical protein